MTPKGLSQDDVQITKRQPFFSRHLWFKFSVILDKISKNQRANFDGRFAYKKSALISYGGMGAVRHVGFQESREGQNEKHPPVTFEIVLPGVQNTVKVGSVLCECNAIDCPPE